MAGEMEQLCSNFAVTETAMLGPPECIGAFLWVGAEGSLAWVLAHSAPAILVFCPFLECTKEVLTQGLCTSWACCLGLPTGEVTAPPFSSFRSPSRHLLLEGHLLLLPV